MKNTILLLLLFSTVFLISCRGPQGPPGFDGADGGLYFAQTFEHNNVNFTYDANNNIQFAVVPIPTRVEVFESDAILVYRLEQVVPDGSGGTADAWSLIPQNFFLGGGDIIQYVYNHTFFDIELLIDGNFDLGNPNLLGPQFTQNQVFRFVVVPSEYAESGVDINDFNAVMESLQFED